MTEAATHPIAWGFTIIKRACRSTLMVESCGLIGASGAGIRLRAAKVDMKGKLDWRNWEESAANEMGHCWMTDCDSLYERLMSQRLNIENKRLAIDLMALRQQIWERGGGRTLDVDNSCGDYPWWIDTSVMLADPFTNAMAADRLVATMETGRFDIHPPAESLMIKEKNRTARKAIRSKKDED